MSPTYSIITNIDQEHMDYYKNMNNLKQLFIKFIEKTPSFGKSFICLDDKNNKEIIKKLKIKNYYTYGTDNNSQFCIKNISQSKEFSKFNINIKLPGKKILLLIILKFLFSDFIILEMQQPLPQLLLLLEFLKK